MEASSNGHITVDRDAIKIPDLVLFESLGAKSASQADLVAFLDRVVVGGISQVPLHRLLEVVQAVRVVMDEMSNPKDGQGKA